MKVVLASTSAVKAAVCREVFAAVAGAEIATVQAPSGVSEQPMNDETPRGAFNRLSQARKAVPDGDIYISIENGIFEENGRYIDRAFVAVQRKGEEPRTAYSDGVEMPAAAVEETRRRGFDTWTVGKVLQEQGLVTRHDDPHQALSGTSRKDYIRQALTQALGL